MMSYNFNKPVQNYFSILGIGKNACTENNDTTDSTVLQTPVVEEIDTEIKQLSSRKLWQILKLNQLKGCELDASFIFQVKQELILRNDYDNGRAWCEPH